jgi:peptide chain release factor 1
MTEKNVIVEIRAGAGGDEAALVCSRALPHVCEICRESPRWKVEMMSLNESGIGGFKEVQAMV